MTTAASEKPRSAHQKRHRRKRKNFRSSSSPLLYRFTPSSARKRRTSITKTYSRIIQLAGVDYGFQYNPLPCPKVVRFDHFDLFIIFFVCITLIRNRVYKSYDVSKVNCVFRCDNWNARVFFNGFSCIARNFSAASCDFCVFF